MRGCEHPADQRVVVYEDMEADPQCSVEKCNACGFTRSLPEGEWSKYRTCPFCGDWFIDEVDEAGETVCCQGCGAEAPADVWNNRVEALARLREVLLEARAVIQAERDCTVECSTTPPEHDLATLDEGAKAYVERYDRAIANIDALVEQDSAAE